MSSRPHIQHFLEILGAQTWILMKLCFIHQHLWSRFLSWWWKIFLLVTKPHLWTLKIYFGVMKDWECKIAFVNTIQNTLRDLIFFFWLQRLSCALLTFLIAATCKLPIRDGTCTHVIINVLIDKVHFLKDVLREPLS